MNFSIEKRAPWTRRKTAKAIGLFLIFAALVGVPSFLRPPTGRSSDNFDSKVMAADANEQGDFASTSNRNQNPLGGVLVYMPDRTRKFLPALQTRFSPAPKLTKEELDQLTAYIDGHKEELGVDPNANLFLKMESEILVGDANEAVEGSRRFVRFGQNIRHRNKGYMIPVLGATIVAVIESGRLMRLNNLLITPQVPSVMTRTPGFEFKLTPRELEKFLTLVKMNPVVTDKMRRHFNRVGGRRNFSFTGFLNRELTEQEETLNKYFGGMDRSATVEFLTNLASYQQLALVHYGPRWMFQVTGFFGLPIEFDIDTPDDAEGRLVIKNLRELRTTINIEGFTSPYFPAGVKTPGGPEAQAAVETIRGVHEYFQKSFGWLSYTGKDPAKAKDINLHTQLKGASYAENASWLGKREVFIIGEGGENIQNLGKSISVLGHEYCHAIVQYSSGLRYIAESGAINEHICDIQGASIDAVVRNQKYSFVIGEDILSAAIRTEKEKVAAAVKAKNVYTADEMDRFQLNRTGIRHLYAPELSYASQLSHYDQYRASYPADCQPSVANDNCGVHYASGILNKATSMIIDKLGFEATRTLFFNTVAYRLGPASSFTDYLVQLVDECKATPALSSQCRVITESFEKVGIHDPQDPSRPAPKPAPTGPVTAPVAAQALSPALQFCGWVDRSRPERIRIVDGRFDGTLMKRDSEVTTVGETAGLESHDCACVTGRITHLTDEDGKIVNAFVDVSKVEDAGKRCALDSRLNALKPRPVVRTMPAPMERKNYCGWVSVSSREKVISIINNRQNPVIDIRYKTRLAPYVTEKEVAKSLTGQCACVDGMIERAPLLSGKTGNVFRAIFRAEKQADEKCLGIRWSAIKLND